ncbi:MAG: ABC transporter substrate-binding protein [Silvanigrellales bacterium]|nr:ABC transporter substrate-binding protein [Silvanigrellales bacterium]
MKLFALAALFGLGTNTALGAPSTPTKVVVALDWTPNTNHTGLYVAKAQGLYAKAGLDVSIVQPAQTTTTQLVGAGRAHFGVSFMSDVIHARAEKVPVQSIAAVIQNNTSCFAWRSTSGIKNIKDWEGKRYGGWGSPEEEEKLRYIMKKNGADFSKLKIVTTGVSDFIPTTERNADFMWIFMAWDGIRAKLAGVKFQTLCVKDIDPVFNQPSPLLITGDVLAKSNAALVRTFLAATTEGYKVAINNPTLAADLLLKEVPELDAALVKESAQFLSKEYSQGVKVWGTQTLGRWESSLAWMKAQGLVKAPDAARAHFSNAFLATEKAPSSKTPPAKKP